MWNDTKMTDNCDAYVKFIKDYSQNYLCPKCEESIFCEDLEAQMGIGNGSVIVNYEFDEDECRHCIKKWPMLEMVYNAVYGDRK